MVLDELDRPFRRALGAMVFLAAAAVLVPAMLLAGASLTLANVAIWLLTSGAAAGAALLRSYMPRSYSAGSNIRQRSRFAARQDRALTLTQPQHVPPA